MDKIPIYLCCWHIFKTWHLRGTKKIKNVEVQGRILQDLHDVMYMSINHEETIDDVRLNGRWQLTTTIACHYMHILEMKKKGFIKNKGYGGHYYTKCGKCSLYPTHPRVPTNH
jgi:hypothetical protein